MIYIFFSLARVYASDANHDYSDKLRRIQTVLIDLYTAISKTPKVQIHSVESLHTKELEDWINEYTKDLPIPEHFIIPVSLFKHISRITSFTKSC